MITDVHTHIWETPDQLGRGAAKHIRRHVKQPWDRPDASVSAHETAMAPVHSVLVHGFESRYLGASVPAKQVANHVARNPDKYIGFAGVDPLGDFNSQIAEAKQLGLVGVTISPAGQACHPSHSRAMKVYQMCVDAGMPVFVHPATHLGADAKLEFSQPFLFDEIAREFPSLRLIIGQIGYPWIDQGLALVGKHDHVYAELSNVVARPWQLYNTLLTAHQLGVTDHLLFGSDYPFCTPEKAITTIYSVNTLTQGTPLPSVPREKLRSIVERDVLACLGLAAPRAAEDDEEASDNDDNKVSAGAVPIASGNGRDTSAPVTEKIDADAGVKEETAAPDKPAQAAPEATPDVATSMQTTDTTDTPVETTESSTDDAKSPKSTEDATVAADDQGGAADDAASERDEDAKPAGFSSIEDEATEAAPSLPTTPPPIPGSEDEVSADEDAMAAIDSGATSDAEPTEASDSADNSENPTDADRVEASSNQGDEVDATQPKKESDA